jgi:uncharacterized protein YjbJ (UPF0337 family)
MEADMATSDEDRLNSAGNTIGGKVKETAGVVTGDRQLEGEGKLQQVKGAVQDKVADVKDAIKRNL